METNRSVKIIEAISKSAATQIGELMKRYPDDLAVHDRRILDGLENAVCEIAWVVGDTHTHMAVLGVSEEQNQMVNCFARLANDDVYFRLSLLAGNQFRLTALDRAAFEKLSSTKIAFVRAGNNLNFTLLKNALPIAAVSIESQGNWKTRSFKIQIRPILDLSVFDRHAVLEWSRWSIGKETGSLFFEAEEPIWEPMLKYPERRHPALT